MKGWKVLKRLHSSFEITCKWCNYSALWNTWHQTWRYDFREIECNIHYSTAGYKDRIIFNQECIDGINTASQWSLHGSVSVCIWGNYTVDFPIGFILIWSNYHTFTLICPVPCLDVYNAAVVLLLVDWMQYKRITVYAGNI